MTLLRRFAFAGLLTASALLYGCTTYVKDLNKRLTSLDIVQKKEPNLTYVVDPPDVLRIEFLDMPTESRTVVVRSDGCITLPYLEDVPVGGLTTLQIREKLEKLYQRYYTEPRILVTVIGYNSKRVYVYGEVGRQGALPYTGTQTVADVIGAVGGVTTRAAAWRVRVIRRDVDHPEIYKVNLVKLLREGQGRQDVSLAEDDVIYVPPTWLAWFAYQIEQILFPFSGVQRAVGAATWVASPPVPGSTTP